MRNSETRKRSSEPTAQTCPRCGLQNIQTELRHDSVTYGEGEQAVQLQVIVPVHECRDCTFKYVDDRAEVIYHEAVCRHLGVLTPSEICALREAHGLSRRMFAEITRLGEATVARWERGALIQNAAYDQFLYLLRNAENLQDLRNRQPGSFRLNEGPPASSGRAAPHFLLVDVAQLRPAQEAFELRATGT